MEVALVLGMSTSLLLGALAAVSLAVLGITGLVWWVRRPVPHERSTRDVPLPLFSHDHASLWARDGEHVEDAQNADLIAARVQRQELDAQSSVPPWSSPVSALRAPVARPVPAAHDRQP